jgi:hypothetical protein
MIAVAIDPGQSSGVVWGCFSEDDAFVRIGYAQVTGGLAGLKRFMLETFWEHQDWTFDHLVVEKFKTRPLARNYKLAELEPIRIEGWLDDYVTAWQWPEQRGWGRGGVAHAEEVLRAKGLWLTGKDVGFRDADDCNAAQMHMLAYLRNMGHIPTIEAYLVD